jgi:general secretion pathway protein C
MSRWSRLLCGQGVSSVMTVRRWIILFYLVGGTFFLAHAVNAVIANALHMPPDLLRGSVSSPSGEFASVPPSELAEQIRLRAIFPLPPDPIGPGSVGNSPLAPIRSSLNLATKLRLIGVVMGEHGGVAAIIEELASKRQLFVRLHSNIPDAGEIIEIGREGIVIRQGDQEELLELAVMLSEKPASPQSPSVGALKPTSGMPLRKVLDRREVDQAMNDLPKLLSQARAVPYLVNGSMSGFRLDFIAPASFYDKIGLQYGDVLQQVNGVEIRDPATMLTLFQQLRNEQTVKLDVLRNNQRSTLTYEIR